MKTLTQRVTDIEEHIDSIEKSLIRLNKDVWKQPYTAMRSTGECACKCHPTQYEEYGYSCQKCWGFHESKAHKPQEDVREKIAQLLIEIRESGESHRNWRHDVFTYVGLILAIVKGE